MSEQIRPVLVPAAIVLMPMVLYAVLRPPWWHGVAASLLGLLVGVFAWYEWLSPPAASVPNAARDALSEALVWGSPMGGQD